MKKKDKIKNVDNDLYQRVDSIIKNKSTNRFIIFIINNIR